MGAAGYVNIYRESNVRETYAKKFPNNDIDKDWWYLKTITTELDGNRYIFDYADDQGYHEGSGNSFWFENYEAQQRVLEVLRECECLQWVEVWT